jgi:hypothetical protein
VENGDLERAAPAQSNDRAFFSQIVTVDAMWRKGFG